MTNMLDTLVPPATQVKARPGLAESWEAPDATTLVFHLRKGIKFHDGSPFNAQVAKWNFDRMMDPSTVSPVSRSSLVAVDKVEVVDDDTIRLRLKQPSSDLLYFLGLPQLSMMTPTAVEKWGKDVGAHPVGTGAFIFQEWAPSSRVRVARNPNYWNPPRPYLDGVEWVITEDASVLLATLITGAVDVAGINLPEHLDRVEKMPGMRVGATAGINVWGMYFNHTKAPMNNLDFRKALDLAVDREAMVKALLKGRGTPANSLFTPALAEYNSALPIVKRDVAQAKALLAQAGYKNEELDFGCWPGQAIATTLCEAVQAQFKDIGLNTKITVHASAGYARVLGQLLYDISILYTGLLPASNRANILYHRSGRLNSGRLGDSPLARKIDQLVEQVGVTYDADARKRLFGELQQLAFDNVVDLYFMYVPTTLAINQRVQNYVQYAGEPLPLHEVWLKD
ncbi:MAG: ABC transporter substrate-binding protein [Chloroflexi bacterium]|nr:ABC transporter substrate-binding protein [Chloroflexota bacterium]